MSEKLVDKLRKKGQERENKILEDAKKMYSEFVEELPNHAKTKHGSKYFEFGEIFEPDYRSTYTSDEIEKMINFVAEKLRSEGLTVEIIKPDPCAQSKGASESIKITW